MLCVLRQVMYLFLDLIVQILKQLLFRETQLSLSVHQLLESQLHFVEELALAGFYFLRVIAHALRCVDEADVKLLINLLALRYESIKVV